MKKAQGIVAAAAMTASAVASHAAQPAQLNGETEEQVGQTLERLDAKLFTAAFVECDMAVLQDLLADDLEFFHDRDGLSFTSSDAFIAQVENGCGPDGTGMKRVLVPESLSLHMLGEYGAMQMGEHEFHEVLEKDSSIPREKGLFIHIWQRNSESSEGWQITRIISYDHEGIG